MVKNFKKKQQDRPQNKHKKINQHFFEFMYLRGRINYSQKL